MNMRYQHLTQAVDDTVNNSKKIKPFRIMEIGVFDAVHGRQMIDRAVRNGRLHVEYYGFDMFEEMTAEVNELEVGKKTFAKSYSQIMEYLTRKTKAKSVKLFKGDSKVTIPEVLHNLPTMDVIFVDGGHSLGTVQSDFEYALKLSHSKTVIILDDYYPGDYSKGCAFLVDTDLSKRASLNVSVLEPVDVYPDSGVTVQFVRVVKTGVEDETSPAPELPAPPSEIFITPEEPVATPTEEAAAQEVVASPATFQAESGDNNTDLQPSGVCLKGCGDSDCKYTGQPCDGSRRCEPRVEGGHLEAVSVEQIVAPSIPEERQEPDTQLELGSVEIKGAGDTDSGSDEQRRDVSEELDGGGEESSSKRSRRSRRARNKRSRSSPEAADSQSDEDLQDK